MSDTEKKVNPTNTPIEAFEELFKSVEKQFEQLGISEETGHKIIAVRTANQQLMQTLQYIPPVGRVKLHDKISKTQYGGLRLGY